MKKLLSKVIENAKIAKKESPKKKVVLLLRKKPYLPIEDQRRLKTKKGLALA